MLFNSYVFLRAFLPLAFCGFWAACRIGPRVAAAWLLAASLLFYGWWNPVFLLLLLASITGNYALASLILRARSGRGCRPRCWRSGIAGNLGALGYYKYLGALLGFLRLHGVAAVAFTDPILPLGISFFTFTQIGYLIDCRRGPGERDRTRCCTTRCSSASSRT